MSIHRPQAALIFCRGFTCRPVAGTTILLALASTIASSLTRRAHWLMLGQTICMMGGSEHPLGDEKMGWAIFSADFESPDSVWHSTSPNKKSLFGEVTTYLLERSRVVTHGNLERSYHCFYDTWKHCVFLVTGEKEVSTESSDIRKSCQENQI